MTGVLAAVFTSDPVTGTELASLLVAGIVQGCIFALLASGLSLVWGAMGIMNFAQGAFYMVGGFGVYIGLQVLHTNVVLSILLAIALTFAMGLAAQAGILSWLLRRHEWEFPSIVATLGLSTVLQEVARHSYGEQYHTLPYYWGGQWDVAGVRIVKQDLLVVVITIVAFIVLHNLVKRTRFGIALRAISQDRMAATLAGIRSQRIYFYAFGLSVALAGLGGAILAPLYSVNPYMGQDEVLEAFVVIILGGLGSIAGAAIGGLALGIIESLAVAILPAAWQEVLAFGLMIIFLCLRPQGLFGTAEARA